MATRRQTNTRRGSVNSLSSGLDGLPALIAWPSGSSAPIPISTHLRVSVQNDAWVSRWSHRLPETFCMFAKANNWFRLLMKSTPFAGTGVE